MVVGLRCMICMDKALNLVLSFGQCLWIHSRLSLGNLSHMDKEKQELVKDFHHLAKLGVILLDSKDGGVLVEEATWDVKEDIKSKYLHLFSAPRIRSEEDFLELQWVGMGKIGIGVSLTISIVGEVTYELALPPDIVIGHPVFHVSMLRMLIYDLSHVLSSFGFRTISPFRSLHTRNFSEEMSDANLDCACSSKMSILVWVNLWFESRCTRTHFNLLVEKIVFLIVWLIEEALRKGKAKIVVIALGYPILETMVFTATRDQKITHELIKESITSSLQTDVRGRVVSWSSAGTSGFKGTRRGTPFAAQTAAANAIRTVVDQGMQRAEVMIKGPGLGRDAALRAIRRSGILLTFVRDVTPMPHNGCRPPKKRRV
ncbi:30S ribosomal protein S11, chloroplastic [Capsicum annuum]|nr:30S ribosomal protein S11, chloroplastic [Capsicum annuum]KAF3675112.1 30S ribosomal protein S11, chloroplastic [Capsicum annuum]